jgi:hypothetical protein
MSLDSTTDHHPHTEKGMTPSSRHTGEETSDSEGLFSTKEQNNGLVQTQDVQRTDENGATVDNSMSGKSEESVIPIDYSPDTSAASQSASAASQKDNKDRFVFGETRRTTRDDRTLTTRPNSVEIDILLGLSHLGSLPSKERV